MSLMPVYDENETELYPRNLFADGQFNEEAIRIANDAHQRVCRQNDLLANERLRCCSCNAEVPDQRRNFCGPQCPGLGLTAQIKTLSIELGLSYLVPMSSLMRHHVTRMTPVGFETILKYLYDDHFGTDLSTAWPKISKLLVFRNNQRDDIVKIKD